MLDLQAVSPLGDPRSAMGATKFESPLVQIREAPWTTVLSLRPSRRGGDDGGLAAQLRAYGLDAPLQPNGLSGTAALGCAWLEPNAWLLLSEQTLPSAPQSILSITDISDRVAVLKLSGAGARDLLAAGCDVSMLAPGRMARVRFGALVNLIIECHADTEYRLIVDVSYAQPLLNWLMQAASNQA